MRTIIAQGKVPKLSALKGFVIYLFIHFSCFPATVSECSCVSMTVYFYHSLEAKWGGNRRESKISVFNKSRTSRESSDSRGEEPPPPPHTYTDKHYRHGQTGRGRIYPDVGFPFENQKSFTCFIPKGDIQLNIKNPIENTDIKTSKVFVYLLRSSQTRWNMLFLVWNVAALVGSCHSCTIRRQHAIRASFDNRFLHCHPIR